MGRRYQRRSRRDDGDEVRPTVTDDEVTTMTGTSYVELGKQLALYGLAAYGALTLGQKVLKTSTQKPAGTDSFYYQYPQYW